MQKQKQNHDLKCSFVELETTWYCTKCHVQIPSKHFNRRPNRNCDANCTNRQKIDYVPLLKPKSETPQKRQKRQKEQQIENDVSMAQKLKHYTSAILKWVGSGLPKRDKKEIERLYNICKNCSRNKNGVCKICGCRTNQSNVPVANKIAMKTEECPLGKW